jgi:hypothetical protein
MSFLARWPHDAICHTRRLDEGKSRCLLVPEAPRSTHTPEARAGMTTLDTDSAERLARIRGMFGSHHDGERR